MAIDYSKQKLNLTRQYHFGQAWALSVALLPNNRVAAGDQNGNILIWDIRAEGSSPDSRKLEAPTSTPIRALVGHTNGVKRLLCSPDGKRLYSASYDHTVRVWDVDAPATGKADIQLDFGPYGSPPRGQKDHPPQAMVSVPSQEATQVLTGHSDWVQALALSSDGRRLVSGDDDSLVIAWDAATGKEIKRWNGLAHNWILAAALNSKGTQVLVSEYGHSRDAFDRPAAALRFWDVDKGTVALDVFKTNNAKYNPEGTSSTAAGYWNKISPKGLVGAAFSPDDKYVALAQGGEIDNGLAVLIDAKTGKVVREVGKHRYGMNDVVFSADSAYLFTAGRDTCVRISKVADGKEVAVLGASRGGQFKDWISAISVSADGRTVAGADIAGFVHIWQVA